MTTPLPAPFKNADIARFATRAKELEKFKPVIAYWCNYFIINQILNKGLHTESDECMTFTTTLMDKLEAFKTEHAGDDTVHDDVAAQAYVEQFALETFNRADGAIRNNRATAATAQTFQAAATFLDLLGIWQTPLNQEMAAKSKYAKFHALRIAKALRNGEDPNLSNPQPEPAADPPLLSPNDPGVQRIDNLQPTVEETSDHSRPPSFIDGPPGNMRSPSIQTSLPSQPPQAQPDVSPLESTPPNSGYFPTVPAVPTVPAFTSETSAPSLPTAPESHAPDVTMTSPGAAAPALSPTPQNFYNIQTPPTQPPIATPRAPSHPQMPPTISPQPTYSHSPQHFAPPAQAHTPQAFLPSPQPSLAPQPSIPLIQPQPTHVPQYTPIVAQYRTDDESVAQAQKHAKWAISALNFDDVNTAVKELRIALNALGAQ